MRGSIHPLGLVQDGLWVKARRWSASLLAAVITVTLMGVLIFASICFLVHATSSLANASPPLDHVSGTIWEMASNNSFILRTDNGQTLQFFYSTTSQMSLPHLQRHLLERARTDVYYYQTRQQLSVWYAD